MVVATVIKYYIPILANRYKSTTCDYFLFRINHYFVIVINKFNLHPIYDNSI